MTDLDKLKELHEKWLIGTDDDAEMAQEAVMETHFLALIERVEKAESELAGLKFEGDRMDTRISELEAALKPFAVWSERISGEAYEEDEPVLVSNADGRPEGVVFLRDLRTASRALGGDHA